MSTNISQYIPTLDETIQKRFEQLEESWGSPLIGHVMRYFCCCKHGLTHVEICDLLSLNDHVLQFVYNGMPTPLRFPYAVWKTIHEQIGK